MGTFFKYKKIMRSGHYFTSFPLFIHHFITEYSIMSVLDYKALKIYSYNTHFGLHCKCKFHFLSLDSYSFIVFRYFYELFYHDLSFLKYGQTFGLKPCSKEYVLLINHVLIWAKYEWPIYSTEWQFITGIFFKSGHFRKNSVPLKKPGVLGLP